jgi:hypothetical protein
LSSGARTLTPVVLPPGRASERTTGSAIVGIVSVELPKRTRRGPSWAAVNAVGQAFTLTYNFCSHSTAIWEEGSCRRKYQADAPAVLSVTSVTLIP